MKKSRIALQLILLLVCSFHTHARIEEKADISEIIRFPEKINYYTIQAFSDVMNDYRTFEYYEDLYRYGRGKTLKKTVYTRNGTTFNYKNKFNIHPRFSHYNENYSVGFQGFADTGYILNQPETTVEITLTPTILTFKIIEKIQVACEFKSMYDENLGIMNNIEVRPEDVARKDLQCSNGSKTETFKMDGNDRILKCSYTTSCSHKIFQTPRTKGFKGRSSSGATVYYDEPGKNLADPYAPWTIAHTQNITINLAKMAKDNGLTQQELALELICGELNYIPTNKVNEKDNNDCE